MSSNRSAAGLIVNAGLITRPQMIEVIEAPFFQFELKCFDADGRLKWSEVFRNAVTRVGAGDLLDKYLAGSTYTAAWYLGLISSTSYTTGPATTDTAASHGGWTECAAYSAGTRPQITFGASSTGSNNVTKAASSAVSFAINGTDTVKGCFVISNNTKSGTTGILYSAGTFTDRAVVSGDTLNVTPTLQITCS
jgi:hypothetical protein